jgi:hypothetical protein
VGSLIIAVVLMNAGEWFVPASLIPTLPEGTQANRVVNVINVGFFISFIVVAVISLGEILRELFRLKHRRHSFRPHGSAHAGATGD